MHKLSLIAGLCLTIASLDVSSSSLVCYYDGSAEDRAGDGKFPVSQINPDHCFHLVHAFTDINNQSELVLRPAAHIQHNRSSSALKTRKPQLKILLVVGGPTFDTNKFSEMVSAKHKRATFIQSAIKLLRAHGCHGINLDWRYPGGAGSRPGDKQRFTLLCKELKDAFVAEGNATNRKSLIVTASVSAEKATIDDSYEVAKIAKYLDFIHVLTFDSSSENVTQHHSPLNRRFKDNGDNISAITDSAMQYWHKLGAPAQKFISGVERFRQLFNPNSPPTSTTTPPSTTTTAASTTTTAAPTTTTAAPTTTTAAPTTTTAAPTTTTAAPTRTTAAHTTTTAAHTTTMAAPTTTTAAPTTTMAAPATTTAAPSTTTASPTTTTAAPPPKPTTTTTTVPPATTATSSSPVTSPTPIVTTTMKTTTCTTTKSRNPCEGKNDVRFLNPNDPTTFYNCAYGVPYIQSCQPGLIYKQSCDCCDWSTNIINTFPTTTTPTPTSTTSFTTATSKASGNPCKGKSGGYFPNPDDPKTFYNCAHGVAYIQSCQPGLIYKQSCICCDWP